jgi:hypothetical protein
MEMEHALLLVPFNFEVKGDLVLATSVCLN